MKTLRFVGPFLILSFAMSMMTPATAQTITLPTAAQMAPAVANQTVSFAKAVTYPDNDDVTSVAVADLNGDGKPDLVVTNGNAHTVSVLLGNGNGTFQSPVSYSSGGVAPLRLPSRM